MITITDLNRGDYTTHDTKIGRVYFCDDYLIAEFEDGVDINFENFNEVTALIKSHFNGRPFGFIANRINSYSIDLMDSRKFNTNFPNLKAYAVVAYNTIAERVFELENHFFKFNRASFKDLTNALIWVENTLALED